DALDGRAIPIDPGPHVLALHGPNGSFATQKVVLGHGERNRQITVELKFPASAPPVTVVAGSGVAVAPRPAAPPVLAARPAPPPPPPRKSLAPYALGTVGLAGLGGYVLLSVLGNKDNDKLAACRPSCEPADVERVR